MSSDNEALILLQKKLDFFQKEYILTADTSRKFELSESIKAIEDQLQELKGKINTFQTENYPSVVDNSKPINLTQTSGREFREALMDAFPSEDDLKIMLSDELDWNLAHIADGNNYRDIVFNLIKYAKSTGQVKDLLEAAKRYNPGNQKLQSFYTSDTSSKKKLP